VRRFLCFFTALPLDEITAITAAGGSSLNAAKERLAWEVTSLIHGRDEADRARDSARRAFSAAADVTGEAVPHGDLPAAELAAGISVLDLLVRARLAASKGEARRLIEGGGVSLGETKIEDVQRKAAESDASGGRLLLRVGKKRMFRFDVA